MKITNNNTDKVVGGLTTGKIRWTTTSDDVWNSDKEIEFDITADDKWRLYTINLGPEKYWVGYINNLRVYPIVDGYSDINFIIKNICIDSTKDFICTNTQCSFYTQYSHPCLGIGKKASVTSGKNITHYTTIVGISDQLIINIDDYGSYRIYVYKEGMQFTYYTILYPAPAEPASMLPLLIIPLIFGMIAIGWLSKKYSILLK